MSFTLRSQRVAYDNIVNGNDAATATAGKERTILGNAGSTERTGGKDLMSVGAARSTDKALNRIITSAGGKTTLEPQEYPENQN